MYHAVFAVLVVITVSSCEPRNAMNLEKLEYSKTVSMKPPQTLRISGSGRAEYVSHSNRATPDRPEIGRYETTLPAGEMELLRQALQDPPLRSLPDHWGRVPAGNPCSRIRVTIGSESFEKLAGTAEPVDPRLGAFMAHLDRLIMNVMEHPRQTLSIALLEPRVDADRLFIATLVLSNRGTAPFFCRSPGEVLTHAQGRLCIQAWPDKPASALQAGEVATTAVAQVEPVSPSTRQVADSTMMEIPPGKSISLRLRTTLPMKRAGPCALRALYEASTDEAAGREVIGGELFSTVIKVNIPPTVNSQ